MIVRSITEENLHLEESLHRDVDTLKEYMLNLTEGIMSSYEFLEVELCLDLIKRKVQFLKETIDKSK